MRSLPRPLPLDSTPLELRPAPAAAKVWVRGSLPPDTVLTAAEAAALLPGDPGRTAARITADAPVVGELDGFILHRWGDVLSGVAPALAEPANADPPVQTTRSDLLDPAGLAAALDVSQAVVHRWTSEGRIPHYKLGHKTVRYRLSEVLASTAQGTAAGKRQTHGREKARKRMDGGLPVRRAGVRRDDSIPAFDWTRTDEKGG